MAADDIDNIPLTEDVEAEPESPYRRRAKAVPVRRGRLARMKHLLKWSLWLVLVLPPMGYGGYRLAAFGASSPHFALTSADDVLLTGNRYVSREEAMNALGLPAAGKLQSGMNIFKVSMEEKRKQLESIPWVLRATLTRAYPNRLAVHIEERTPVAFVNVGGRVKLVDGEGVLLEKPERAAFNFPVLTGLDAANGRPERAARLGLYAAFLQEAGQEAVGSGWMISEVDLADDDDLKAMLARGHETLQLHFGRENFAERFRNFLTLLPELRRVGRRIDSIDLRYGNQIVVNPQEETSPPREEIPASAPPPGTREN
jgi:cell division septal protein FtsQ